jgi:hypothetical protein
MGPDREFSTDKEEVAQAIELLNRSHEFFDIDIPS